MAKISKRIRIVSSSYSTLSSMSERSRLAILAVLSRHYTDVDITLVNNFADLDDLVASQPDLVFLGMQFIPSHTNVDFQSPDKIWITDYLDAHSIPYTGSGQQAHELEHNKPLAKQRALENNLRTSPYYVALQHQIYARADMLLEFPLFIKPANRGGGLGVDNFSVAHNFDDLESKVESITTQHQSDSLIEEYLPGREFSVAILKNDGLPGFSVMPVELVAEENKEGVRILSSSQKAANTETVLEVTDQAIKSKICALALNIFHALGARDYGRIDIRLDKDNIPHFLEANLLPSLIADYGNFPKACLLNMQLNYEPMILQIVHLALERTQDTKTISAQDAVWHSSTGFIPSTTKV